MDPAARDKLQNLFADLTGLLEDMSVVAVEGQSPAIRADTARAVADKLRRMVRDADRLLDAVDSHIVRHSGDHGDGAG